MDLSILDKSAEVTPHLVRLYDNHQLYSLAKDNAPEARMELVNAVSEVLNMESSKREQELIADILMTLTRQAEKDLRQAIAERLALTDQVPLRLILMLANDEIEIASPILKHSNDLGELDLIYIIKSKSQKYWQAIAERNNLTGKVINVLAETRDVETALTLVQNENAVLTQTALTIFSDMVQTTEDLALPLLKREEATKEIIVKIYKFVGEELKSYIKTHHGLNAGMLSALDDVIEEFTAEKKDDTPSETLIKAAATQRAGETLTPETMIKTLRRGQVQAFVAQFSVFTGLDTKAIIRILKQSKGFGLAVTCKGFGICKADFLSLFLLTNAMRSKARLADMKEMGQAIEHYDSIDEESARDIATKY